MSKGKAHPRLAPGQEVSIKVEGARKVKAVIRDIRIETETIEVTRDGSLYPFVADTHRVMAPGRSTTTITLEVIP